MMQAYIDAANTISDKSTLLSVVLFLIAASVLIILAANVADACKKLFGKKTDNSFQKHCEDAEDRFKRGEKHIAENHDHITDLKEGQRVLCVAVMALLNHELHNGNSDEMSKASAGVNEYLINRK